MRKCFCTVILNYSVRHKASCYILIQNTNRLLNISLIKIILGHFNYVLKMIHTILKCIVKLFSKVSHPKRHFLCHTLWLSNFLIHCLKSDSPDSFCQTGFSFLQLRRERSFFQRTKLVSFCLCPLLNDEAIDYKLYRDYPDIYFSWQVLRRTAVYISRRGAWN